MKRICLILIIALGLVSCGNSTNKKTSEVAEAPNQSAKVYFTKDITPENLMKLYKVLGREATGKVGIKLHMGEPGGNHFLKPDFVREFVTSLNGTFIDANTAYTGRRNTAEDHMKVADEHGFTAVGPVDILDADGDMELPIEGGKHLKSVLIGSHFANYDFTVILTHFKGHAMGGFGGSIKNMSIGIASVAGKCMIHSAGKSSTNAWVGTEQNDFLESMAEGAKGIADYCGDNILYINVMNNLSVDCDCDSHPEPPRIADIGMLASLDPVALDKACVDLVYQSPEDDRVHLVERIESRNGTLTLDHAEKLGLGSQTYELVTLE